MPPPLRPQPALPWRFLSGIQSVSGQIPHPRAAMDHGAAGYIKGSCDGETPAQVLPILLSSGRAELRTFSIYWELLSNYHSLTTLLGFCCLVSHHSTILLFPPPSEPRGHPCASISGGWVAGKACVLQPVIEGSFSRTTNGDKSCVTTGLPNHETTNRCLSSAIPPLFGLNQVNSQFWPWFPKLPSAIKCDSFRWR
ncbi:hypothetical protein M752DRAFT_146870 [Aspergillus phoenicis ATCC 13157]|uniref:Uncharacterized protein n=1 Tax=Aspergillus phoenicis ATCC 13157 TaxID=1353007 RepID=A0A370PNY4_ASPPH|nr:hypothetical protein M752DRAFT_146870 [Aspergillus phoenicis ATCC 13157]